MNSRKHAKSWRWIAPLGLIMIGMGFSMAGEAAVWKGQFVETWKWIAMGTAGLVVLNAGISVFGEAVVRRMWDEINRSKEEPDD